MAEQFSIVKWQNDFTRVPTEEQVLIVVLNDNSVTTKVAWKLPAIDAWVSEGKLVTGNIILWSNLPEYRNLMKNI